MKAGLSVQELKQLTAHRIAQTQDHRGRGTPDVSPVTSPPTRDQFSSSDFVSSGSSRSKLQNSPSLTSLPCDPYIPTDSSTAPINRLHNPALQTTRLKPVQTPSQDKKTVLPHGLTVQELKELTRMRLAREAIPEPNSIQNMPQPVPVNSSRRKSTSSLHGSLADSPMLTSQSYRVSGSSTPYSDFSDDTTTSSDRTATRRQGASPMPVMSAAPPLVAVSRRPPILRSSSEEFSNSLVGTPELPKKQQTLRTPLCDHYDSALFPNLESPDSPKGQNKFKGSKINTNVSYGRDRSNSEVGSLAYEVAESVLLTPTPNSPITPKFSTKVFLDKSVDKSVSQSNKERALVGILLHHTDSHSDSKYDDSDAFVVSGKAESRVFLPSIGDHHY